ncbi:MAG: family 16 glycosylhydrolase [Cognatishimia sp.]|uniref:family 16 glycosylhydrolase n=1 Tax=Cognatishimia sp. TaxID=2211648 RepID=UPI003B8AD3A1
MLRSALLASAVGAMPSSAQEGFIERFKSLNSDRWYVAEYDFSHPSFDTDWRKRNARIDDGLQLKLLPHVMGQNGFAGASIRTHKTLHYGDYSAKMQAARGDGLVTGVFTYTGPYYGTRHDEIDIEILGRDTTKLHVAWFVDGKLNQRDIPLGFDAADCIHTYRFKWQEDRIAWLVNDQKVFETTTRDAPLPKVAGRFYANLWAADESISNWAGHTRPDQRASALIQELRFEPLKEQELTH